MYSREDGKWDTHKERQHKTTTKSQKQKRVKIKGYYNKECYFKFSGSMNSFINY